MPEPINLLIATPEVTPLAQTGGLAEVAGSLPKALVKEGLPTMVIMPGYTSALAKRNFKNLGRSLSVKLADKIVPFSLLEAELAPGIPVYAIKNDLFFDRPFLYGENRDPYPDNPERFTFFSKAVIASLPYIKKNPDIILANDWQTGLIMPYLLEMENGPKGVFVIHNQGYLGLAPAEFFPSLGLPDKYYAMEGLEYYGKMSFFKAGIVFSDAVVTVSPTYAREIQTPENGHGLDGVLRLYASKLTGILNGVDYDIWNPEKDKTLPFNYSVSNPEGKKNCKKALKKELGLKSPDSRPLFSMVNRLTAQKGLTLLVESAPELFRLGLDLLILGTGESWFEEQLTELTELYPDQMVLKLGYDVALSHRFMAGSDFVLVPSIYEPCGLVQMYALRYGAIPVVRACGGLNDTVRDFAGQNPDGLWDNGFKFSQFQAGALVRAVRRAAELYTRPEDFWAMSLSNMKEDFSWASSARSYVSLFKSLLSKA